MYEKENKASKKKLIQEIKGTTEAKKVDTHKDIQLNVAKGILDGILVGKGREKK